MDIVFDFTSSVKTLVLFLYVTVISMYKFGFILFLQVCRVEDARLPEDKLKVYRLLYQCQGPSLFGKPLDIFPRGMRCVSQFIIPSMHIAARSQSRWWIFDRLDEIVPCPKDYACSYLMSFWKDPLFNVKFFQAV